MEVSRCVSIVRIRHHSVTTPEREGDLLVFFEFVPHVLSERDKDKRKRRTWGQGRELMVPLSSVFAPDRLIHYSFSCLNFEPTSHSLTLKCDWRLVHLNCHHQQQMISYCIISSLSSCLFLASFLKSQSLPLKPWGRTQGRNRSERNIAVVNESGMCPVSSFTGFTSTSSLYSVAVCRRFERLPPSFCSSNEAASQTFLCVHIRTIAKSHTGAQ